MSERFYKIWHIPSGKWNLYKVPGDVKIAEFDTEEKAVAGMQRCITKVISYYDKNGEKVA